MGQPSDPKRTPRGRPSIESWLAERLSRTLGENPDDDLDDIDEIVPLDDPGLPAYNLYDDEADTTRRRIAVAGAPPAPHPADVRRPARSVGYPVAGGRFASNEPPSHLLDPDGFVTTPSIDAPLPAVSIAEPLASEEAPTVVADGPRFQGQDPFEIREPGPGEVTNPVPPDVSQPDEWDLLGDATAATVVNEVARHEPFEGQETPTVAAQPWEGGTQPGAGMFADATVPEANDEAPILPPPEPLDPADLVALEASVEGFPIEVAMPAAEGEFSAAETPIEPRRPEPVASPAPLPFALRDAFSDRLSEDPHTTWSDVEVASGAPPPPPPPTAIAMPTPSLKVMTTRTPVPSEPVETLPPMPSLSAAAATPVASVSAAMAAPMASVSTAAAAPMASVSAAAAASMAVYASTDPAMLTAPDSVAAGGPMGAWMPAPTPALPPDAETEIRSRSSDEQPTPLGRTGTSAPPVADAPRSVVLEESSSPDLRSPHIPAPIAAPAPIAVPPAPVPPPMPGLHGPSLSAHTPVEAKVELSVTEHGLPDLGSNVPMWLAAAFGLVTAVVFVAMMVAVVAWLG